jgi:aminocarboxymuconate-semialdehyde decarboxylase
MKLLQARTKVPYVRTFAPKEGPRLIILPGEDDSNTLSTSRGRPVGPDYFDISRKIAFMDQHGIDASVISLANPWLDFLDSGEAAHIARLVNEEVNDLCSQYPGRLWAFGALPLSTTQEEIVAEIFRLLALPYIRGFVMGTGGMGEGLDDPRLYPIYTAIQQTGLPIFLHPHYGLPKEVFGPRASDYGHVLPLALGFPLETTIAISKMILCGVWDKFKNLKVLIAHSGGTLPFLAGRLESCIAHDNHLKKEGKIDGRRSINDILRHNIYLDAVIYSATGLEAAIRSSGGDRVLFGTSSCISSFQLAGLFWSFQIRRFSP